MKSAFSQVPGFYGGLSGIALPTPKYLFPEDHKESSRLTYYASFFNSIEINSTFYRLPLEKTVAKWMEQVPENFHFTFKLWRAITHNKGLQFKEEDVEKFFRAVSPASKKGCILIQFPPSLSNVHIGQLEFLLTTITRMNVHQQWKIALEFRNRSWYDSETYDLLESYKATLVIQDIPKSATPRLTYISDTIYLRFHGPTGNYRGTYSDQFLREYAALIEECRQEGKTVYAYFNNTMGDAFQNLQTLNLILQVR